MYFCIPKMSFKEDIINVYNNMNPNQQNIDQTIPKHFVFINILT